MDDDHDENRQSLVHLQKMLSSLTTRVIDAEMEDFELDKNADFSCTNGVGIKNNIYAILLLGVYEVLMEYGFETGGFSPESCENVIKLFTRLTKLSAVVRNVKEKPGAGKKGRAQPASAPKVSSSLLSLECVSGMLSAMIEDQTTDHNAGLTVLRDNRDLMSYLVSVGQHKVFI